MGGIFCRYDKTPSKEDYRMKNYLLALITLTAVGAFAKELSWVQLPKWQAGKSGPSDREHPLFFIHPSLPDQAFLYSGLDYSYPEQKSLKDLWSLNLKTGVWKKITQQEGPAPKALARATIDGHGQDIIVSGGKNDQGVPSNDVFKFSIHKNIGAWTKITAPTTWPKQLHAFVSIPNTSYLLSFGGLSLTKTGLEVSNNVYIGQLQKDKKKNILIDQPEKPEGTLMPRYGFPYAYDKKRNRLIVAVGQGPITQNENGEVNFEFDEKTYAYDVMQAKWSQLTNAKLSARRNPCWALDEKRNQLYVFSGTVDGRNAIESLDVLDLNEENGEWKKGEIAKTSVRPTPRSSCVGLYDKNRDRILFGFGNTLNAEQTDIQPWTDMWALQL